jgi:hypothetical protein
MADTTLLREWKTKLHPKIVTLEGVNGLEVGRVGLVVRVERNTPEVQQRVMDFIEREAGEDLPYSLKVVGRVVSLAG